MAGAHFQHFGLKIHFAHRTFAWASEARGKAHVHVVVIGFGAFDSTTKHIYDYEAEKATVTSAKNISPYLVEGSDIVVTSRSTPISDVPACEYGNKPTDGGFLILEEKDRAKFLAENPEAKKYLRALLCAEEYLHSIPRWCFWLTEASPADISNIEGIKKRVQGVRDFRLASKKAPTREKASQPTLFAEIRQPTSRYIVVPRHTSENRRFIPFGYFEPNVILHDSCSCVPSATPFQFGVLSSTMHMAWVRQVCGRLESRVRYSANLVYNNFPWPQSVPDNWPYFTVPSTPLPLPTGSLLFSVHFGFFECRLGVGFLFIRIQLRLGLDLVGFDLRFFNRRIRIRLFCVIFRGGVHRGLLTVDGGFGGVFIVVDGRLLFVAADENEGGEYYRY
jgi:hypothetical protein